MLGDVSEKDWGLVLGITKSPIELHDGVMTIKSEVRKDTSVTIEIPFHFSDAIVADEVD